MTRRTVAAVAKELGRKLRSVREEEEGEAEMGVTAVVHCDSGARSTEAKARDIAAGARVLNRWHS